MNFKDKTFIADIYIFKEFFLPFLFSLGLFLCITVSGFVLFGLIDLMVKYGMTFDLFFKLFLFSFPEMLFYSTPMSILLGTLLSSGRLMKDNEFVIFQVGGRNVLKMFSSVIIFSLVTTLIMIFFNFYVVSKSNHAFSSGIIYAQIKKDIPFSKKNIFYKDFEGAILKRTFYAKEFNSGILYKPIIEEFSSNELIRIISADKAKFEKNQIKLENGYIYNLEKSKFLLSASFDCYSFDFFKNLESFSKENREPKEMNYFELRDYINVLKKSGQSTSNLEVQMYQKISIPFTCFLFCLTGIGLGLSNKSKNASFGFAFSLFFIFGYYILMFLFTAMGSTGKINSILASWIPNIIVFLFALSRIYFLMK